MEYKSHELPLVSIIVITYNSAKYVLETLESAKAQTYQNIELIISDDCSTDNTIEVCRKWLAENKERFVNVALITVEENTGTSANLNRACIKSTGKYIKPIAGDDVLANTLIETYVSYMENNETCSLVFSQNYLIDSNSNIISIQEKNIRNEDITFDNQFKGNLIFTPTIMFTRKIFDVVGGYDANLKIEDVDFYLNILFNKGEIHFIKETLTYYRVHDNNISGNKNLMLQEHINTLMKYKQIDSNYKRNFIKFSKGILYAYRLNGRFKFKEAYQIISKENKFVFRLFFDPKYWFIYFFKAPIKKILKK